MKIEGACRHNQERFPWRGRRQFLTTGLGLATGLILGTPAVARSMNRFAAVAFDAFPIFDPRPSPRSQRPCFPAKERTSRKRGASASSNILGCDLYRIDMQILCK
jgi:hypothetical protein